MHKERSRPCKQQLASSPKSIRLLSETVRKKLNLSAGDIITFEIDADTVTLRKAKPVDLEFSNALVPALSEWESQHDEEAYRDNNGSRR